jgi:hypothetical protein
MLTTRSSLILGTSTVALVVALLDRNEPFALLSLSLLLWIWFEWMSFQRFKVVSRSMIHDCSRSIDGQTELAVTLVTDRPLLVRLKGQLSAPGPWPDTQ